MNIQLVRVQPMASNPAVFRYASDDDEPAPLTADASAYRGGRGSSVRGGRGRGKPRATGAGGSPLESAARAGSGPGAPFVAPGYSPPAGRATAGGAAADRLPKPAERRPHSAAYAHASPAAGAYVPEPHIHRGAGRGGSRGRGPAARDGVNRGGEFADSPRSHAPAAARHERHTDQHHVEIGPGAPFAARQAPTPSPGGRGRYSRPSDGAREDGPIREHISSDPAACARWLQKKREWPPNKLWYELDVPNNQNWQKCLELAARSQALLHQVFLIIGDDFASDPANTHVAGVVESFVDKAGYAIYTVLTNVSKLVGFDGDATGLLLSLLAGMRTLLDRCRRDPSRLDTVPWALIEQCVESQQQYASSVGRLDTGRQLREAWDYVQALKTTLTEAAAAEAARASRRAAGAAFSSDGMLDVGREWRDDSVLPTTQDMLERPRGLPKLESRRYASVDELLMINYRLLREDALYGLRESLHDLLAGVNSKAGRARRYVDVRMVDLRLGTMATGVGMEFKLPAGRKVSSWMQTSRLMPGSLVLLVPSAVESVHSGATAGAARVAAAAPADDDAVLASCIFATIQRRDEKDLARPTPIIELAFNESDLDAVIRAEHSWTMLESSVFFEACAPTLRVLKTLGTLEAPLPFDEVLRGATTSVTPPKYLLSAASGAASALPVAGRGTTLPDEYDMASVFKTFAASTGRSTLRVLQPWPEHYDFELNPSQVDAMRACLTRSVALVQGPPGTGKTHVGVLVARILLANAHKRRMDRPLVFVCYTNHALDQLLAHLQKYEDRIARIGGGSKHESMKSITLAAWAQKEKSGPDTKMQKGEFELTNFLRELGDVGADLSGRVQNSTSIDAGFLTMCEGLISTIKRAAALLELTRLTDKARELAGELVRTWQAEQQDSDADSRCNQILDAISVLREQVMAGHKASARSLPQRRRYTAEHRWLHAPEFMQYRRWCAQKRRDAISLMSQTSSIAAGTLSGIAPGVAIVQGRIATEADGALFSPVRTARHPRVGSGSPSSATSLTAREESEPASDNDDADADLVRQMLEERMDFTGDDDVDAVPGTHRSSDMRAVPGDAGSVEVSASNDVDVTDDGDDGWDDDMSDVSDEGAPSGAVNEHSWMWRSTRPWAVPVADRRLLVTLAARALVHEGRRVLMKLVRLQRILAQTKQTEQAKRNALLLRRMKVVGFTTTGAAKHRELLKALDPEILLVEEAAEILEAHVLGCLTPKLQHLILIGDHQQLRPKVDAYHLATRHALEVSLFERLVRSGIPHVTLTVQHRMRPEIAMLITPSIYRGLANAPRVNEYPPIAGVRDDVFFFSHNQPETGGGADSASRQNLFEADMIVRFADYLLRNKYAAEQITILTMYTGQLLLVRRRLQAGSSAGGHTADGTVSASAGAKKKSSLASWVPPIDLRLVRVSTVDNFQGEENDIIILSLVRSNDDGSVGFLKEANRVCVALSRARHGMFIFGNGEMLERAVPLWKTVIGTLRDYGRVGASLRLQCQSHAGALTDVALVDDFKKVPEGGCSQRCLKRMGCGHSCRRSCHHDKCESIACTQPCAQALRCGHTCPKPCCTRPCGPCNQDITVDLPCGHSKSVRCADSSHPMVTRCTVRLPIELPCGHTNQVECADTLRVEGASAPVSRIRCTDMCNAELPCGHRCTGSCADCTSTSDHKPCAEPCSRTLLCGHPCTQAHKCKSACPPCKLPCMIACSHSRCANTCGEPCTPCAERCDWQCPHFTCTRRCGETCNRPRCEQRCTKGLPCGHQCFGICGEVCPTVCQVCNGEEEDPITFEPFCDVRAVVQLPCTHAFCVDNFDAWVRSSVPAAASSADGRAGLSTADGGISSSIMMLRCPLKCGPVQGVRRYKTEIQSIMAEIARVSALMHFEFVRREIITEHTRAGPQGGITRCDKYLAELVSHAPDSSQRLLVEALGLQFRLQLLQTRATASAARHEPGLGAIEAALEEIVRRLERQRAEMPALEYRTVRTICIVALCSVKKARGRPDPELLHQAADLLRASGEAIPNVLDPAALERDMVVAVMRDHGGGTGHWYKCPNGHYYVIGECGGAMERSRCPDCGAGVGGGSHTLLHGNTHASEIDSSAAPAWPM